MPDGTQERERIREAMLDLSYEKTFRTLTLEEILKRAGVDQATFDLHFEDLEDCFCETYEVELEAFLDAAHRAREAHSEWRDRLRAVAYTLFRVVDSDPRVADIGIVEVRTGGERAQRALGRGIEALVDLVDEGRAVSEHPETLSRATAESVAGGIFAQLFNAAAAGGGEFPAEDQVVPKMMYTAVLPYLGVAAASEELEIPPPPEDG